jgi:hypothetical protein
MMGYLDNYFKNCKSQQTCVRVNIEHTIHENFHLSPEARDAKWGKSRQEK